MENYKIIKESSNHIIFLDLKTKEEINIWDDKGCFTLRIYTDSNAKISNRKLLFYDNDFWFKGEFDDELTGKERELYFNLIQTSKDLMENYKIIFNN